MLCLGQVFHMVKMALQRIPFLVVAACVELTAAPLEIGPIWFVGDSITQSNADGSNESSPRLALYHQLVDAGYSFTFTGHHALNVDGLPATGDTAATNLYHYHSGVSGAVLGNNHFTRTGLTGNIADWWQTGRLAVEKPNIILVMAGTNDIGIGLGDRVQNPTNYQMIPLEQATARLAALIDTVFSLEGIGNPIVIVSSIPPNRGGFTYQDVYYPFDPDVVAFNEGIPDVVAEFQAEGRNVLFMDAYGPLNEDFTNLMTWDKLHPNAAGNEVIGRLWFEAIESALAQSFREESAVPEPQRALLCLAALGILALRRRRC